jgi:hypothetical protein
MLRYSLWRSMENLIKRGPLRLSYQRDLLTKIPGPNRRLWRYMDFAKFVSMLDHGGLYFSAIAALEDELEGAPYRLPPDASDFTKRIARAQFEQVRRTLFVNCWYMFRDESTAMWALYGNEGVAVRTTYDRLIRSTDQRPRNGPSEASYELRDGIVAYSPPERKSITTNPWHMIPLVLQKRHWYQHEREFRLIYCDDTQGSGVVDLGSVSEPPTKGKWIYCSLNEMVSSIVVAPNSPAYLEEVVRSVCDRFGLDPKLVKRSRIEEKPPAPLPPP